MRGLRFSYGGLLEIYSRLGVGSNVFSVWRSGPWDFCSDSMVFSDNLDLVKWTRNSSFHEGHSLEVPKIQHEISLLVADWSLVVPPSLDQQGLVPIPDVVKVPRDVPWTDVNVFVDAAIRGEFGIIVVLVLDRSGSVIEVATAKRKVSSPFVAELAAIHWGCCRILQMEWRNVSIFSDCQSVVNGLSAGFSPSGEPRGCSISPSTSSNCYRGANSNGFPAV
ncbi:hypothetical protein F8388_000747 [Cannabis sativa]|uniref:RNase H type-1 domain-containing protein n=1 Tax=Cannabis sativa TaxID=3483 RepID=A0A7J6EF44_CANSA|nr:hypothetical protein F8388_000747 [Cannabis sativa]